MKYRFIIQPAADIRNALTDDISSALQQSGRRGSVVVALSVVMCYNNTGDVINRLNKRLAGEKLNIVTTEY